MKTIYKIGGIALLSLCLFTQCDKEDDYTVSKPEIKSAAITPTTFSYGDTVRLTAQVSDADARLAALNIDIVVDNRVIAVQSVPLSTNQEEINVPVFIPLVADLPDKTEVKINLRARNLLKGETSHEIGSLTGERAYYNRLYLVTDNGAVYPLAPEGSNKDRYVASGLTLLRSFNYKIAQKITGENQIDYSGLVWGNKNGKPALVDENGESLFAFAAGVDYIDRFVFDAYSFGTSLAGQNFSANDLIPDLFEEQTIDSELFKKYTRSLEKNQELTLFGELADQNVLYNFDFFERLSPNKVKFLGETGNYTIYYNTYRKHVIIGVENPAYPNYILVTGGGLGYPTKVTGINKEHVWWGFGNVRNFILFRKIADNVFQGTFMIHAKDDSWVGLKPYENTSWGGEKRYDAFTFTGEPAFESADGGDWKATENVDPDACYRVTINWVANTVNVEKIIL
ncbi:hypothetical protein FACS1894174_06080 [Bacteroidia bacterium]|nr:hypothetical protein FACS1894174_06080 [Bacteroidia bacterium]